MLGTAKMREQFEITQLVWNPSASSLLPHPGHPLGPSQPVGFIILIISVTDN